MNYDVIICGGGLAGLSLVRELSLSDSKLSVLIIEKRNRPLDQATLKVGESTIEVGAYYFEHVLELGEHIRTDHYEKFGLRYFFTDNENNPDFSKRPEYGVSKPLAAKSHQFNRGRLETHLRELAIASGAELLENSTIKKIEINTGNEKNKVIYIDVDGNEKTVSAKWVIDATGRRKYIQKKFNLSKKSDTRYSASWFRVDDVVDVDNLVSSSNTDWHGRVTESRWFSTNLLMGEGYWVWLIPINQNITSIGIVASEDLHNFDEFNTFEKSLNWLEKYEKDLVALIDTEKILDFKTMKNYTYSSQQVFSTDRWACTGEAGVFADPFYSLGSNLIAYCNSTITELIKNDRDEELNDELIDYYNKFYISLNENLTHNVQVVYPIHGKAKVMSLKILWDYFIAIGLSDPLYYHKIYLDPKLSDIMRSQSSIISQAQSKIIQLFLDWAKVPSKDSTFEFLDYIDELPTLKKMYLENIPKKGEAFGLVLKRYRESIKVLEELAHIIFRIAIEDTMPGENINDKFKWINITAISLNPENWIDDGLFEPKTDARDYGGFEDEIRQFFKEKQTV